MNNPLTNSSQHRSFIERAERLHEERKTIADDISELFREAKGSGFDVATIKAVIRRRASPDKYAEADAMLELYESQLGINHALTGVQAQEAA